MRLIRRSNKKGFTLIELSFAVAFISVLLITVTLITNEIVSIYRKGYAIKAINQSGRDLIDDFQDSLTQSPPSSISAFCLDKYSQDQNDSSETKQQNCNKNNGFYSVYQQFYAKVRVVSGSDTAAANQVPTGGIFCSGKYTYIWNTGYLFNEDNAYEFVDGTGSQKERQDSYKLKIIYNGNQTKENFRLVKIEDTSRAICSATLDNNYPSPTQPLTAPGGNGTHEITVPFTLPEEPEELLAASDASLALFDLVVFQPAHVSTADRLLFSGSFILATVTGGVDIMSSSNFCQAPSYFSADFSYCAINKFNFTIQSSGN